MNSLIARTLAALAVGATAVLSWAAGAKAETVVVQPGQQPAPPPPPAATVVTPPAPEPSSSVVVNGANGVTTPGAEHTYTRPNRRLLMSGLIIGGAPYVASVGIGATSSHRGDSNLFIPVLGPWLDLGARPDCPSGSDCGVETGNKVLLVGDGILQTVGALEVVGAFVFPETVEVTTVATNKSGGWLSLSPARMGVQGYGLSAFGQF